MTAAYASDAAASVNAGTADVTVNKPSGCVVGDTLLAFAVANISQSPGAWSPVGSTWSTPFSNTISSVFTRVVDGTEGATFTFTRPITTTSATVVVVRLTGAGSVQAAAQSNIAANSTVTLTGVTAGVNTLLLQILVATSTPADTFVPPGGTTRRTAGGATTTGTAFPYAVGDDVVQAGATGSRVWTRTGALTSRGMVIAINPQPKGQFLPLI